MSSKQNKPKRFSREFRAVPAPSANAELLASIQVSLRGYKCIDVCVCVTKAYASILQKRLGDTNQTSVSEKFNPEGDSGFGFLIEPLKGITAQNPLPKR